MSYDLPIRRSQAAGSAFTVATLPTLSQMVGEPIGMLAYTSDSGLYAWNGSIWVSVAANATLALGITPVVGGTPGYILYDNAGFVGELANTGTGNNVLATSPTLVTPVLGAASGTSLDLTSATGLTLNGAILAKTKTTLFSYTGSAQTYTMATGCVAVSILTVGGAGGGGFGGTYSPTTGGSGGGAGAGAGHGYKIFRASDISASSPFTVTVGQGGAGGTAGSTTGTQGGITSVGTIAYGGGGGGGGPGLAGATSGGGGSSTALNQQGASGTTSGGAGAGFGLVGGSGTAGTRGDYYIGASGGGCSALGVAASGGASLFGLSAGGAGGGFNTTNPAAGAGSGNSTINGNTNVAAGGAAGTAGTAGTNSTITLAGIYFSGCGGGGGGSGVNGAAGGAGGLGGGGGGGGAGTTAGGNGGAGGNGLVFIVEYF